MNESKNTKTQNCKNNKMQNNAQTKATGEQTPSPAVPNRAHTQMSSAKNSKNCK